MDYSLQSLRYDSVGMFWRFLPLTDSQITFIIIDLDNPDISDQGIKREIVERWLLAENSQYLLCHWQMLG